MIVFTMQRGDDRSYQLTVTDKDTGEVVDITGCTIKLSWKVMLSDITPTLQKTFVLTDPTNGVAEVSINSADTNSFTERKEFYFDVEITKTDTKKETLVKGKWVVELDVT